MRALTKTNRLKAGDTNNVIPFQLKQTANTGMPEMDTSGPVVSRYEFWPAWFFYAPVVLQSLWYSLRYRDICLPLIVNPSIWLSGMVGESKKDILELAGSDAKKWILPFVTQRRNSSDTELQLRDAKEAIAEKRITYPLVAKPDRGCRGAGVKLIKNELQLKNYIENFPSGADFLLQKKSDYEAEAGVFWIRYPGESRGQIFSLTLKYTPCVIGDGSKTLNELIDTDKRASQVAHLYKPRHTDKLNAIIPDGQKFQLAFAGSHSRGSIFKNGNKYISEGLTTRLDEIFDDFEDFHYGRLDIKFKDIDSLMAGTNFQIIEINGASSEATHIWDSKTPLSEIFKTLLFQYKTLYRIGFLQKKAGHTTPSVATLFKTLKQETELVKQYPETD